MASIDILNPNLGLQGLLDPAQDQPGLPESRPLPSNVVPETGLAKHFDLAGSAQLIDRALVPTGIDEELLAPDVFRRNLGTAFDHLKSSRNPELRRFAREDLAPIMEDCELYDLFAGLLVGS